MLSWRMSPTTIFLGRLFGLYLVAISVGMLANRRRTLATLDEMARSGPWMLFSGVVATAAGLAVVLGHNVWSGGALPVVVTLVGWAALLKGVTLLLNFWRRDCRRLQGHRVRAVLLRMDGRRPGDRVVGDDDGIRRLTKASDGGAPSRSRAE